MIPSIPHRAPVLTALLVPLCTSLALGQNESVEERLDRLEQENEELRENLDAVAGQMERLEFRDIIPTVGDSKFGMGPAASKVYSQSQGLSIGGYGEALFTSYSGDTKSRADLLRAVLYTGYKFDDKWVFNSEFELEHAEAGDGKEGEAAMEFAYLEYLHDDPLNVRAGLLLIPMGFINEMHEPTTFYGPHRPETERRIIPTTWREVGVGIHGDVGPVQYKLQVVNGLDAAGFSDSGIRSGRQKGSKAIAEDLAVVGRLDWVATDGLLAGVSGYYGDSGQSEAALGSAGTTIFDAHVEYRWRGLRLRGLYAQANIDDTDKINTANSAVVGEKMTGWYVEAGYDVMDALRPEGRAAVVPYARYEMVDTHASVAPGYSADPMQDETIVTLGVDWLPIDQIVFKASIQDFDRAPDRFSLGMGYVF